MVLTSTSDSVLLNDLAQLADKIVKVQSISTVHFSNLNVEVKKFKGQFINLVKLATPFPKQKLHPLTKPSFSRFQKMSAIIRCAGIPRITANHLALNTFNCVKNPYVIHIN